MRLRLYSIHDRLLGVFLTPFVARADIDAMRQVNNTLSDSRSADLPICQKPSDYDLYYMASFDDESGEIFPESHSAGKSPCVIAHVIDLVSPKPSPDPILADR